MFLRPSEVQQKYGGTRAWIVAGIGTNPRREFHGSMTELRGALVSIALTVLVGCSGDSAEVDPPIIELADLGIVTVVGQDESGDPLALFTRILDGGLLPDEIVVLNSRGPFIRTFNNRGDFTRAVAREGEGPGEVRRPISLAVTDGGYVVNQSVGIQQVERTGQLVRHLRMQGTHFRGAIVACEGRIAALAISAGFEAPGALVLFAGRGDHVDTLVELGPIRGNSRRAHPFFGRSTARGIVFYTEEIGRPRLLEVSCNGNVLREIALDSIGPHERFVSNEDGTMALHPAAPPLPSGMGRVRDHLVWAVQIVEQGEAAVDSMTAITSISTSGERRVIMLRGWVTVLDSGKGELLVSLSEPVPHVARIDGRALLRHLLENGVDAQDL